MRKTAPPAHTYSCRAECQKDVAEFLVAAKNAKADIENVLLHPDDVLPDVQLEFESSKNLTTLNNILGKVSDSHVMRETLRPLPLEKNTLERQDHSVNEAAFESYFLASQEKASLEAQTTRSNHRAGSARSL